MTAKTPSAPEPINVCLDLVRVCSLSSACFVSEFGDSKYFISAVNKLLGRKTPGEIIITNKKHSITTSR
jgi:hypothetical protein